ncbi:YicC/YloC family endoribonuclease [Paenibacillus sp. GYB003]|uniref:YicC/YloC family endoribonuclease n=1 Tax=Paenibacillus sp. GYB003 TaxID=2994392 RepID=UPI002F96346A
MIRSMTGFGQRSRSAGGCRLQVEIKSVNHRYTEISVRLPREWLALEDELKREIGRVVGRGKVDAFVAIEKEAEGPASIEIDWAVAEAVMQASERLKERFGLRDSPTLRDLLAYPGLLVRREDVQDAELLREPLLECVREAAGDMLRMRETEGKRLEAYMLERLERLEALHRDVEEAVRRSAGEHRAKLHRRLTELLEGAVAISRDDPRLLMEAAVLAERSDIGEELSRLSSHFAQCRRLLGSSEPAGRKLDFLIQEMNREINTIGSKSNRLEYAEAVVEMKAELEKLREQTQNIE